MSAINKLIDAAVQCVKCGGPIGCGCWVKLECPKCKRTMTAERELSDPPGTARVLCLCQYCDDGGGFPDVIYFDGDGREIHIEAAGKGGGNG